MGYGAKKLLQVMYDIENILDKKSVKFSGRRSAVYWRMISSRVRALGVTMLIQKMK